MARTAEDVRRDIERHEAELVKLRRELQDVEAQELERSASRNGDAQAGPESRWPMKEEEYERYARQLVVPGFGIKCEN
jgi:adenylyltransferase/sulfurtransferase